jgi:D-amino-acid dehydrogenase
MKNEIKSSHQQSIGIIGGGITGLCTAYYLNQAGHQVTILDKGDFQ